MDLNEWIQKCAPPLLFTYCKQSSSMRLTFLQLEDACMTTSSREMSPEPRALETNEKHSAIKFGLRCTGCPLSTWHRTHEHI